MKCENAWQRRPYELLCTKTRRTYKPCLWQYGRDIADMRRLAGIACFVRDSDVLNDRLLRAIEQAE